MYIDAIDDLLDTTIDRIYEYIDKEGVIKSKKLTCIHESTKERKVCDTCTRSQALGTD